MNEHLQFLQGFFKKPGTIGAIAPSSPDLARKMIEDVQADENNVVLEIGCGTGAITRFLQDLIPNRKSFIGIEIEKNFVDRLETELPNLNVVCGDACQATQIIAENQLGKVSYIISGLPFVVLPKEVSDGILNEVDKLMEQGCLFRTFQYAHGYNLPPAKKFRQRLNDKYGVVKRSDLVFKNIPPAYTLTWTTL
ncbi:MAG TPA: methyltransferase domain-containing protein [Pyrinomonadaceae bacterium]|nr:methyltransferase domain-containing protein [Pyrinomonadaceae bacterium]